MATRTDEYLGNMTCQIQFLLDDNGRVVASIERVDSLKIMTEDLEYLLLKRGGIETTIDDYRGDDVKHLADSIEMQLRLALATRPNRTKTKA